MMTPLGSFTIPRFTLPGVVSTLGHKLPQWPHTLLAVATLNTALHLKLLPQESVDLFEDRTFVLEILDTGSLIGLTYHKGHFRPLFSPPETPDLAFRANLSAFLQIATRQEDPDTLFFNRELMVEGDTELGLVVKNMLDALEWPKIFKLPGFPAY